MSDNQDSVIDKLGDAVEDGKKLVNEVLKDQYEATHKKHTFSVFDTWYELVAVIFAVIFITFQTYRFIAHGGYEGGLENIIAFLLETVMAVFVVFCFCAIVEVQEKLDVMSDNIDLMAGYMHDYYLDIEDDLTVIGGFEEQTYVQQKTPFADEETFAGEAEAVAEAPVEDAPAEEAPAEEAATEAAAEEQAEAPAQEKPKQGGNGNRSNNNRNKKKRNNNNKK